MEYAYPVCKLVKDYLGQFLELPSRAQQVLFRALFPLNPLTDRNHVALVDVMQLAQIFHLVKELSKPASDQDLLESLLEGLNDLPPVSLNHPTQSTLATWLKLAEGSSELLEAKWTNDGSMDKRNEENKIIVDEADYEDRP